MDAVLQEQKDAKKRMVDLIEALKAKDELDEGVLALMNSLAEQILAVAGNSDEAVALAEAVKEKAFLVAKLLAEKSFKTMQSRGGVP